MKKYILLQGKQELKLLDKIKNKYYSYKSKVITKLKGVRKP